MQEELIVRCRYFKKLQNSLSVSGKIKNEELGKGQGKVDDKEDINNLWDVIKTSVIVVTKNTVGVKGTGDIQEWFEDECEMVMKEKNYTYQRMLQWNCTRQSTEECKSKRRIEKKLHRKKKRHTRMSCSTGYSRVD